MKDYSANIIDYRGGKALLLDSLDIMHMVSREEVKEAEEIIEENYANVDYILFITSMPFETLRPKIRSLFQDYRKSRINCFRHITPRGIKTWSAYLEEQTKETLNILKVATKTETEQ